MRPENSIKNLRAAFLDDPLAQRNLFDAGSMREIIKKLWKSVFCYVNLDIGALHSKILSFVVLSCCNVKRWDKCRLNYAFRNQETWDN